MKNKTNEENKAKDASVKKKKEVVDVDFCPVRVAMEIMGGRWKPVILYLIHSGTIRFGQIHNEAKGISKQMLTKELRSLEKNNIINRKVYPVVPPHVEYTLTEKGKEVLPALNELSKLGELFRKR